MSIVSGGSPPVSVPELRFLDAVDRKLIHRRQPSEAFLTDAARTGADGFVAAALLPATHPHYAGHTGPSRHRDPMLLLECARQAVTYAAHTMFDVEPGTWFVLRGWSAEFPDDAAPPVAGPTELVMTATTSNPRLVRDRLHGLDYELELWPAGRWAGRVRMEVGFLSHAAYTVIRSRKHHGPPPSSDNLTPAGGHPVTPAQVGRIRPIDVLLHDVTTGAGTATAALRIPVDNPSMFDHAQDHVPGMVLVDAARQLATLATRHWGGPPAHHTHMTAMTATFTDYAELNEPIHITATPNTADPHHQPVAVTFQQAGTTITQTHITIGYATPAGGHSPGEPTP